MNLAVSLKENIKKTTIFSDEELRDLIINLIRDKKGKSIISLDLRKIPEAITDFFVICSGDSTTQVRAIVDHLEEEMRNSKGIKPLHTEGTKYGEWALIDFGEVIVHVFIPEKREFYQLEDLWHDAKAEHFAD